MNKQKNRGKRDRSLQFWCDEDEYLQIEKMATDVGISKGKYCRQVILGEIPQVTKIGKGITKTELEDIKKELLKSGVNLNQLTKKYNASGQAPVPEALEKLYNNYYLVYKRILEVLD